MFTIRLLVERCRREEPEAFADLWLLVVPPVRRALRRFAPRLAAEHSDDFVNNFFKWLLQVRLRPLLVFRGRTEAELDAFLYKTAFHHMLHVARDAERSRRREEQAVRARGRSAVAGESEPSLLSELKELRQEMSDEWGRRLDFFLGTWQSDPPPSARTQRRWKQEIIAKYFENIGGGAKDGEAVTPQQKGE